MKRKACCLCMGFKLSGMKKDDEKYNIKACLTQSGDTKLRPR
jgi:hypothetical protein